MTFKVQKNHASANKKSSGQSSKLPVDTRSNYTRYQNAGGEL